MSNPNRSHNLHLADRLPFPREHPRLGDGTPRGSLCHSEIRAGLPWLDEPSVCYPPTAGQSHCSVCHYTFSALGQFDAHRSWGWCLDPATLGLVRLDRWPWLWGTPEGLESRAAKADQLAEVRAARAREGTQAHGSGPDRPGPVPPQPEGV